MDPTDPRFIHTAGTAELAKAVAKRKKRKVAPEGDAAPAAAVAPLSPANDGEPCFLLCVCIPVVLHAS